jgi:hypothetical protein
VERCLACEAVVSSLRLRAQPDDWSALLSALLTIGLASEARSTGANPAAVIGGAQAPMRLQFRMAAIRL